MASFNLVVLMGNLTRDPELRYAPKGTAITKIGLAVNESWTDPDTNEKREKVTFVDVTFFGRRAEVIAEHFRKGRGIHIQGKLDLQQWEDKTTHEKKSKLAVIGQSFTFLPDGNRQQQEPHDAAEPPPRQGGYQVTARQQMQQHNPGDYEQGPPDDGEVPF